MQIKIQGFWHLIISACSNQEEGDDNRKLRAGTTMFISNPSGVGKTIFALALMRSLRSHVGLSSGLIMRWW